MSPADGLHPSDVLVPPVVNTGGVRSAIQFTVRDAVEVLPQKSLAVHVLVCEREHPSLVTLPSLDDTVGSPHASVAVAVPSALLISPADGLHPSDVLFPPVVIVGGVASTIHVIVLDSVDVLLQPSLAVNVLVSERPQPMISKEPSDDETVGLPHASVAVAVPSASSISPADGLHPRNGTVPPVISVGGVLSDVQVTVLAAVDELPHASIAVNVLVCEREQPLLPTELLEEETVGVLPASAAVAVPSALLMSPADGLQPNVNVVPPVVRVGAITSRFSNTSEEVGPVPLQGLVIMTR
jgi:hypothetical protein